MSSHPDPCRPMLLVSRHEGARQWLLREAESRGWRPVRLVAHLEEGEWRGARGVAGTLPLSVIAQLCAAGVPVWQIDLPQDAASRGAEMSAADMVARGARLRQVRLLYLEEIG